MFQSIKSAFKIYSPSHSLQATLQAIDSQIRNNLSLSFLHDNLSIDIIQSQDLKEQIHQASPNEINEIRDEKEQASSNDSSDHLIPNDQNSASQNLIGDCLQGPKKRKNKRQTKLDIQHKQKDDGRGGNCIASNITKTLIRVTENRLQNTLRLKFKSLIGNYQIKSQKENTIIILLILYDLVKTQQLNIAIFENIFSFFLKSLIESKQNCEKKMVDEPERKNFHIKNRKMYLNFIKINREIYSKLVQALKGDESVQINLETISDIISDTYDRKQREIQKALSKLKSIILNHVSLRALFRHEQNDIEGTLFEAIDYAYRRNLEKRCNQTKKKVMKFINSVKKDYEIQSEEEKFFVCYTAIKLVGEKNKQIWEEFAQSTNLKRQFNQTIDEGKQLSTYLRIEIPAIFSRLESKRTDNFTQEKNIEMDEETEAKFKYGEIYLIFVNSANDIEF